MSVVIKLKNKTKKSVIAQYNLVLSNLNKQNQTNLSIYSYEHLLGEFGVWLELPNEKRQLMFKDNKDLKNSNHSIDTASKFLKAFNQNNKTNRIEYGVLKLSDLSVNSENCIKTLQGLLTYICENNLYFDFSEISGVSGILDGLSQKHVFELITSAPYEKNKFKGLEKEYRAELKHFNSLPLRVRFSEPLEPIYVFTHSDEDFELNILTKKIK